MSSIHNVTLSQLASHLAGPGAHLGDVVWLSTGDVHEKRSDLRTRFAAAGLPESLAPADISAELAFAHAAAALPKSDNGVFLRRAEGRKRSSDMVIVRHVSAPSTGLDSFETCARVGIGALASGVSQLAVTQGAGWGPDVANTVSALDVLTADRYEYATAAELGQAVIAALLSHCGGIRLRERGNVYWCPAAFAGQTRALAAAVLGVGSSYVSILPVHDSAEARGAVARGATESFESELRAISAELEKFHAEMPRVSTLERRITEYQALAARVELYADVLETKKDGLLGRLEGAKAAVRELIAGADAA